MITAEATTSGKRAPRAWAIVASAAAIFLVFSFVLGSWIMDDAGISYAYARNAAAGHGFVSQPGRAPVEGFSNFLWVLMLIPFFWIRLFDPVWTPKILASALVIGSFWLAVRTLHPRLGAAATLVACVLIGSAPPIVIWSGSGLENSLILFLAVAWVAVLVREPAHWTVWAGGLNGLLALTHPENLTYVAAGVLVCVFSRGLERDSVRATATRLAGYLGAFGAVFVPVLVYRLITFGLPFPHTYYAKRTSESLVAQLSELFLNPSVTLAKLVELFRAIAGPAGVVLVPLSLAGAAYLAWRGRLGRLLAVVLAVQWTAVGTYLWIEVDWMGEYRFATIAVAMSLILACGVASRLLGQIPVRPVRLTLAVTLGTLVPLAIVAGDFAPRLIRFASNPTTTFEDVTRHQALKYNTYADVLGLENGSVFLADLGGTLYYSRLVVYDAAGLCEPDVIRTLKQGTVAWLDDHRLFYDWVLEEIRPTFITTHQFFTRITAFELDPRFLRDYAPIDVYEDEYVRRTYGLLLHSGDWVRRAVLKDGDLQRLRAAYNDIGRRDAWIVRLLDRWRGEGVDASSLMESGIHELWSQSNPHRAATLFQRVLDMNPDHYGARFQLALALDYGRRSHEARPVWSSALERARLDGDRSDVLVAHKRLFGTSMDAGLHALYEEEDSELAAEHFGKILEQQPEHYGATYQLAVALDRSDRPIEARALWERVLKKAIASGDAPTADTARRRLNGNRGSSNGIEGRAGGRRVSP